MLFFIVALPLHAEADGLIQQGESLNLERCIEIAVKMHPYIAAAKNTVSANESRIGQAKANYYPQITLVDKLQQDLSGIRFIGFCFRHKRLLREDERSI